ncbi:MAG: guanylate kinase [Simkaniaceae bacterium]|nr:guanylate kinase [Simkaniaceae bacterium]
MIVLSAPAGTGKTTLTRMLIEEFPKRFVRSVSCTTRSPREGEVDGRDYLFLTKEAFEKQIEKGDFLEHTVVFEHYYGTMKSSVEAGRRGGRHVLLVIDTTGARFLRKRIDCVRIFIAPPSFAVLKERLQSRRTESEEVIRKRLDRVAHEVDQAKHYDYRIINDTLPEAYAILKSIIVAEEHRNR